MTLLARTLAAMDKIAPLRLAESWDNVGLLLEPFQTSVKNRGRVLLTIDLTANAVDEAISKQAGIIISYHPPIFKPISSLRLQVPLQRSLLRCAAEGIAVYSPHTALDAVNGGVNDWLAQGLSKAFPSTIANIHDIPDENLGGLGRRVSFERPVLLDDLVAQVKLHLGISSMQIGLPINANKIIRSVAICAGSGGAMLKDYNADVYWTGEMSHHEVLAALANGRYVILCGHTNTERGYLQVLRELLQKALAEDSEGGMLVDISQTDQHPLRTI